MKLIRGKQNKILTKKIFSNNVTIIVYKDLNMYLLNNNITLYMPNYNEFIEFQRIYVQVILNRRNKVIRSTRLLENVSKIFKTKYYFENYLV